MRTVKHPDAEATKPQLRLLAELGQRTGIRPGVPKTRAQASRRIDQLKSVAQARPLERAIARDEPSLRDPSLAPASSFRDDEIVGYGSSARFAGR